jgi:hypothetical protein
MQQPDGKDRSGDIGRHRPVGIGLGDQRLQRDQQHHGHRQPDQQLVDRAALSLDHPPDGPEHRKEHDRPDDAELRGKEFQPVPDD